MGQAKLSNLNKTLTIETEILNIKKTQVFKYVKHFPIEINGFKGIIFNIANEDLAKPCMMSEINGKKLNLKAVENNDSLKWKENDKIRVMYLNENEPSKFTASIPYFIERLLVFENRDDVITDEYDLFTRIWNIKNSSNTFDEVCDGFLQPKQTIKDDILTIII
jgi:hypothetical protein